MTRSDAPSELLISRDRGILRISLNRPTQHNSFSPQMHLELEELFAALPTMDDVRVVVLAAEGKYFSAGGDVRRLLELTKGPPLRPDAVGVFRASGSMRIVRGLLQIPQPVVAAVHGDAVGVGATIALLSDIVIMKEGARVGDTHVKAGLVAGDGGTVIWPRLVGVNRAKELLMTGRLLEAREAYELGLANHVFAEDAFEAGVTRVVDGLLRLPPFAVQATKALINRDLLAAVERSLDFGLAVEALSARTEDHKVALQAFLDKTPPEYTGR